MLAALANRDEVRTGPASLPGYITLMSIFVAVLFCFSAFFVPFSFFLFFFFFSVASYPTSKILVRIEFALCARLQATLAKLGKN